MADQHDEVPLKNLSFLSMETLIGYMHPQKIFQVAIESESFKRLAESIKVPVDEIHISVGKPSEGFVKCIGFNTRISFGCIDPEREVDQLVRTRINGKPMKLHETIDKRKYSVSNYYSTESFSFVEMKDIYIHLTRLFAPKKSILYLHLSPSTINCFAWRIPFNTIYITCDFEYRITWEDIKNVIENETNVSIKLKYSLCRDSEGVFMSYVWQGSRDLEVLRQTRASLLNIAKMIKCEELSCEVFDFFSVDDLINSQCKRIVLSDQVVPLTGFEINTLLKTWQKGERMTNLEQFLMFHSELYKLYSGLMEGIELHDEYPTHPIFIERHSKQTDVFGNEGGLVIKRETDGMLATIMMKTFCFEFLVWKDEVEKLY